LNEHFVEIGMANENRKYLVDAVMFDLDGTLIDSVPIYYEIIDIIFEKLGVPAVPREILMDAMDDGDFDWGVVLPDTMKIRKKELSEKAGMIIDKVAPPMFRDRVKLIPGAEIMFGDISAMGAKMGLVTSTPGRQMENKMPALRSAGLEKMLEAIVTADDVRNKKPSAEPLVICSEKLGIPSEKCVYVGDTRVDIRAGKAAGMKTVGVLTGFDGYSALKREAPDAIIDSIAQLNAVLMTILQS
jgi:phosphoglycolate phosphatase-like HAD superfamily hydrolase